MLHVKDRSDNIGLTAHYTAYAWYKLGIAQTDLFITPQGRFMHLLAQGLLWPFGYLSTTNPEMLFLAARHRMIDYLLTQSRADTIVELSAGLSERGYQWTKNRSLTYVETDLAEMVGRKADILLPYQRTNHLLIPLDAVKDNMFEKLSSIIPKRVHVIVVCEGLISYFEANDIIRVFTNVSQFLSRIGGGQFLCDITPRENVLRFGVLARLFLHLMGIVAKSPPLAIQSIQHALELAKATGFDRAACLDPMDFADAIHIKRLNNKGMVQILHAWV